MIERVKAREVSKAIKVKLKVKSKSTKKIDRRNTDVTSTMVLHTPGP